jgi:hypothetical protein
LADRIEIGYSISKQLNHVLPKQAALIYRCVKHSNEGFTNKLWLLQQMDLSTISYTRYVLDHKDKFYYGRARPLTNAKCFLECQYLSPIFRSISMPVKSSVNLLCKTSPTDAPDTPSLKSVSANGHVRSPLIHFAYIFHTVFRHREVWRRPIWKVATLRCNVCSLSLF